MKTPKNLIPADDDFDLFDVLFGEENVSDSPPKDDNRSIYVRIPRRHATAFAAETGETVSELATRSIYATIARETDRFRGI